MDECPHGMEDPSWCSLCSQPSVLDELQGDISRPFAARYDGHCEECNLPVRVGERLVMFAGVAFHEKCVVRGA